jgi:hypothetical protein
MLDGDEGGSETGAPGEDRVRSEARHLAGALAVAALLAAFHRALPQLHALNFSTEGPGPTAGLVALLVTGWTVPLAARLAGGEPRPRLVPALAAGGGLALAASLVPHAATAVVAGLAAFPLLAVPLVALVEELGRGSGLVLAAGVLLHQALRVGSGGAALAATSGGRVLILALAAALVAAWLGLARRGWAPAAPGGPLRADAACVMAAILVEAAFLGSPDAPAAWLGASRLAVAGASAAGLAVGAALAPIPRWRSPRMAGLAAGVLVLAAADLTHGLVLGGLAVLPAQAALVVVAAAGAAPQASRSPRAAGVRILVVQAGAALLLVALVWAGNWPFVPGGTLVRGRAPLLLAALVVWPAAALLRDPRGARWWP